MPIVYLCSTGTYSSIVAANLHIGRIDEQCKVQDIISLPHFGEFINRTGIFLFIGEDSKGDMVYTLGTGCEAQLIKKSALDLAKIMGYQLDHTKLIDMSNYIPKYLGWFNTVFHKQRRIYFAKRLYRQLKTMDKEVRNFKEQGR
ncbi:MAG: hypothetical protein VR72_05655 [Clostridiaceae bacterium BRH_c20a]|nr:MAG: hypothetical protein VR72_05655 [Clostridiaceae bacterium BRH_c20a]